MQQHSTVRTPSKATRFVWLVLGGFFAFLTGRVLLWEVHSLADLTAEHWLTVGALVGAIASGVWLWRMLWAGKVLTAIGLALAFTAATVYCLIGSAGRGDELAFKANAAARKVNTERATAMKALTDAKAAYEAAMAGDARNVREARIAYESALKAEQEECESGDGNKCKAKRKTTAQRRVDLEAAETKLRDLTTVRRADVEAAETKVSALPPEQRENGKLKRAAEIIAFFYGADQTQAERGLALIWPFIPPAVCEVLTIVFLHLAFGVHGEAPVRQPSRWKPWLRQLWGRVRRKPSVETEAPETVATVDEPGVPPPGGGRKPRKPKAALGTMGNRQPSTSTVVNGPWRVKSMNKPKALAFVQARLADGGEFPSQDAIAAHVGVTKSAVSKWVAEWEAQGLIAREKDGRCKVVSLPAKIPA